MKQKLEQKDSSNQELGPSDLGGDRPRAAGPRIPERTGKTSDLRGKRTRLGWTEFGGYGQLEQPAQLGAPGVFGLRAAANMGSSLIINPGKP